VRTRVVHCSEAYEVYIGRPSVWGNPFHVAQYGRAGALRRYREWLQTQPELIERARQELKGRVLGCWCKPRACHGDVLVELLDGPPPLIIEDADGRWQQLDWTQ